MADSGKEGDHYTIFADILSGLESDGAKGGKMFGHHAIKVPAGKIAAIYWHDHLLVKLPPEQYEEWLKKDDVTVFNPGGDRPMNGWAQVPANYVDDWEQLAEAAFRNVNGLASA